MKLNKIKLPFRIEKPVLALGSQAKNTVCFAKGQSAYFSPVHPDLNDPEDFSDFEKHVKYFLGKNPKIIACDLHPEYQSTKFARQLSAISYRLSATQHHHAHIASCMAENGLLNQKVIGVAFDGTGLGSDDKLWGAEFLLCDYKAFKRAMHLKEVPLLGGEKAILEPWRLLYAWGLNKKKNQVLEKMRAAGFNSPLSSSAGRLFDAVGSIVLERDKAGFEAELAIQLEKLAFSCRLSAKSYNFRIIEDKGVYIIDPAPMLEEIITDLKRKEPRGKIAYQFHLTAAEMIRKACLALKKECGVNKIVLSGGVFQNNLLLRLALDLLYKEGFKVFTHKYLSCNDSGISLGQAAIANSRR